MPSARFQFCDDCPVGCQSCARQLRRALEQVAGIEEIAISVKHQRITIGYSPIFLDYDSIGEKLADLGYVVRPISLDGQLGNH